jgi:hypothetical protein
MIISHDYKFIFIKTNKTAGTSVEIALSRFCGPKDIITPISPEDEKARRAKGYRGAQNYSAPLSDYEFRDWRNLIFEGKLKRRFYHHISAREISSYVKPEVWQKYYKFCFERNPWDRVISMYYWRYQMEPRPTIAEFIASEDVLILKRRGRELYTFDGQVVVDKVFKFEALNDALETIGAHLRLPGKLELVRAKSGYRKDKRNYRDVLSKDDRKRIAALFSDEIELLGYEF